VPFGKKAFCRRLSAQLSAATPGDAQSGFSVVPSFESRPACLESHIESML